MDNVFIKQFELNGKLRAIDYKDDEVEFVFDNMKFTLKSYHEQDCCENVYADFEVIKYYTDRLINKDFSSIRIMGVPENGVAYSF